MISFNFFNSIPFNAYIVEKIHKKIIFKNKNALFDKINENKKKNEFISCIEVEGWNSCPNGYASYTKFIDKNSKFFLVVTDLKVKPYWTKIGKTSGLSIVADQYKIQEYINSYIQNYKIISNEADREADKRIESFAIENIHEIRSINSSLYNIGYELQEKLTHEEKYNLVLSKNIVALSELISARIELTDILVAKEDREILKKSAPKAVFKSFDKIQRCYTAFASKSRIKFNLIGESRGMTNGLEHFELIPMIIIDNAVKYSPNDSEIEVELSETQTTITAKIKSWGPKIHESEKTSIFEKNFRGEEAINTKKNGNGIGLFFVKKLLDSINSTITASQLNETKNSHGKIYYKTNFEILFQRIK